MLAALLCWAFAFVLWLLYVCGASWPEVGAGIGAAAIATVATLLAGGAADARFRPRWRWALELGVLPLAILRDTGLAGKFMLDTIRGRPRRGRYVAVGPLPVKAEDGRTSARRALLVAAVSVSPNAIVVAFDQDEGLVLMHQLVPRDPALDVRLK